MPIYIFLCANNHHSVFLAVSNDSDSLAIIRLFVSSFKALQVALRSDIMATQSQERRLGLIQVWPTDDRTTTIE
jgi:hypothetical protein